MFRILKDSKFLIVSVLSASISLQASAFTVTTTKADVLGKASGHEEITRQAIVHTEQFFDMTDEFDLADLFDDEGLDGLSAKIFGTKGFGSSNFIIQGNYATDHPVKSRQADHDGIENSDEKANDDQWPVDLKKFHQVDENVSWHGNPNGQVFHFLRNIINPDGDPNIRDGSGKYQTARNACNESSELILKATKKAVEIWGYLTDVRKKIISPEKLATIFPERFGFVKELDRGETVAELRKRALFYIGHATHIIQDSFSPAHTRRDLQTGQLSDLCKYKALSATSVVRTVPHVLTAVAQTVYVPGAVAIATEAMDDIRKEREIQGKICQHQTFDYGDSVWLRSNRQVSNALSYGWPVREQQIWEKLNEKGWIRKGIEFAGLVVSKPVGLLLENELGGVIGHIGNAAMTELNSLVRTDLAVKKCRKNFFYTDSAKHMCLNHESRLARSATMKYLIAVSRHLYARQSLVKKKKPETKFVGDWDSLEATLRNKVFSGNQSISEFGLAEIMPDGIFQCESIN